MCSLVPIPGDPWPHDMVITIEDGAHALLDLLWIREAWNLHPVGDDLPPLLSDTPASAQLESDASTEPAHWRSAWPDLWKACVRHAGLLQDARLFDQLSATANGSAERAELLRRMFGPSWRDAFGDAAFTDRYHAWTMANFKARQMRSFEEQPERMSLAALIPAWRAGLGKIVVVPCRGTHTRVIGEHSLLMTAETRDDPQRYSEALAQFH